jgi:hypothetical protein
MTDPNVKVVRPSRLSVAALMESVRIREAVEALDKHRTRVVYAIGASLLARLALEVQRARLASGRGEDIAGAVPEVSLAIIPYFAALWFMALRGRDRFGFGIALGAAVIEATSQLVGLARGSMPATAEVWPVALVVVTHAALAYAAFEASRDFPSTSSSRPWVLGFVVATLFLVGVPSMRSRVMRSAGPPVRVLTRPNAPSAPLRASLAMVSRCAKAYADANPATGYPRTLHAVGPGGTACIADTLVVEGEGRGWMFSYVPGERDESGRTATYTVMARQSASAGQGVGFFIADQTGAIKPSKPIGR